MLTPKALYSTAQGRASAPWVTGRHTRLPYAEGVIQRIVGPVVQRLRRKKMITPIRNPGRASAPWSTGEHPRFLAPKALHSKAQGRASAAWVSRPPPVFFTPKALHSTAQGRASAPWVPKRPTRLPYAEGVIQRIVGPVVQRLRRKKMITPIRNPGSRQ